MSKHRKTISFRTLGCRLNQLETDALASEFRAAGYTITGPDSPADVYIINTCTVTNQADIKSRNALNRILNKQKDALYVITGCFAENHRKELENNPSITCVVPNDMKRHIFSIIDSHFSGEIVHPSSQEKELFEYLPATGGFHTRSMIKIQDGCDNFCTFCIIPFVRGRATSRGVDRVLANIREVLQSGVKEIVLTGINISRYRDGNTDFASLVEHILDLPGDFRIRIPSMEPDGIDDRFYRLFRHPKMCPHIHLCLQSGSDRILSSMRRMYTTADFRSITRTLHEQDPLFNITTDIMAGFPGEEEEDHTETLALINELGFSHIHTFKYSVRSGTKAEKMAGQVSEAIKKRRSAEIRNLANRKKAEYRSLWVGREQTVLIEKFSEGFAQGYGEYYTPVKIPVSVADHSTLKNSFKKVRITHLDTENDFTLVGTFI